MMTSKATMIQATVRSRSRRGPRRVRPASISACWGTTSSAMMVSSCHWGLGEVRLVRVEQTHLDETDDNQDHEEDQRRGGGIAELEALERLLVDEPVDDAGGVDWPAFGGDRDRVEDLE